MARAGPPKIVLSTSKEHLSELKDYATSLFEKIPHRITEIPEKRAAKDPILEIVFPVVLPLIGWAIEELVKWLRSKRGRGHVKYKTIEAARSQAMHDLETEIGVPHYELEDMRTMGSSFRLIFREIGRKRYHEFLISRSCKAKSYRLLRSLREASQ